MGVRALVVIVLLAVLAGLLLYLPCHLWAKRKLRPPTRESWITIRITRAGALFYGLMVLILFAGFALGHVAPNTIVGQYMKSALWQVVFVAALTVVWTLLESMLRKRGFQFYRRVGAQIE